MGLFTFLAPLFGAFGGSAAAGTAAGTLGEAAMAGLTGFGTQLMGGIGSGLAQGIAGKAVGGLLGGDKSGQLDLAKLRRDAEANGFNPLTVLGATGGRGFETSPSLSSGAYIADAISRGIDTGFNRPVAVDPNAERTRANNQAIESEMAARKSDPFRSFGMDLAKPVPRPSPDNQARIPVYSSNGATGMLLKNIADRYGIKAFDTLSQGDLEEIGGGSRAEAEAIFFADKIADVTGVPLFQAGKGGFSMPQLAPVPAPKVSPSDWL